MSSEEVELFIACMVDALDTLDEIRNGVGSDVNSDIGSTIGSDADSDADRRPKVQNSFNVETYQKDLKATATKTVGELAKLVLAFEHGSIGRSSIDLVNRIVDAFQILDTLIHVVYSPNSNGRTCGELLGRIFKESTENLISFLHSLLNCLSAPPSAAGDSDPSARDMRFSGLQPGPEMRSMTRSCGFVLETLDRLAECPLSNAECASRVFVEQIGQYEDVADELQCLIDQAKLSTTSQSTDDVTGDNQGDCCINQPHDREDSGEEDEIEVSRLLDLVEKYAEDDQPLDSFEVVIAGKVKTLVTLGNLLLRKIQRRILETDIQSQSQAHRKLFYSSSACTSAGYIGFVDGLVDECRRVAEVLDDLGIACHSPQCQQDILCYAKQVTEIFVEMCDKSCEHLLKSFNATEFAAVESGLNDQQLLVQQQIAWFEKCRSSLKLKLMDLLDHIPCR